MKRNIKHIISQLTLEEKAGLCSGLDFWHTKAVERLGIPSIMLTDGPHGLRKQNGASDHLGLSNSVPSTCFPAAAGMASTWNRELIEKVGVALGEECQAEGVSILLGPGANIKRSPLCGRNFEYFSEDPYLSSELVTSHVKGVQSQGVGTSLKHFAANNQEHRRMTINTLIDERTLREIYLASFEMVVKNAQPWTVMSAYNQVNGSFASENQYLLTDILKNEWGLKGFVVSDWLGVNELVAGLNAGLDLEMPSSYGFGEGKIIDAVNRGIVSENTLNQAIERLLTVVFKAIDYKKENVIYDKQAHHQLAREVASESIVLLKNEDAILPLTKEETFAVIGAFAKTPRYQGGGSSKVLPTQLETVYDEFKRIVGIDHVTYAEGYSLDDDQINENLIEKAKEIASEANVAVLFVGLPDRYESEGYDRTHLNIPKNHRVLIEEVTKVQQNTVVVLSNGAPIEMPWIKDVKGVIEGYLGGQGIGGATVDVLFGLVNPSGKLAETFPVKLQHNPSYLHFPGEGDYLEYKEGIFVGYRYYDTKGIKPLFPFGYGLSYTNFELTNLSINKKQIKDNDVVTVKVKIKNIGDVKGKEVIQLYVKDVESSVVRPSKELKGFEKIELEPNEEKVVSFQLDKRAFAYYNLNLKDWHVESGEYQILIGRSSEDIILEESIYVNSTRDVIQKITKNSTIGDLMENPLLVDKMKKLLKEVTPNNTILNSFQEVDSEMTKAFLKYFPLRAIVINSKGTFTEEMMNQWLDEVNELNHKILVM